MRRVNRPLLLCLAAALCFGCAGPQRSARPPDGSKSAAAVLALDLAETRQAGQGPAFRPSAVGDRAVALGVPVEALRCRKHQAVGYGAHIELFAENRGMVVPAGIGVGLGGRCAYPLHTLSPTGVIEVDRSHTSTPPTVGELFALWGQRLSPHRLAGFAGRVAAFVDGVRWHGDPRRIPLVRHTQVVLELGPFVPPHRAYLFPPGQ